MKKKSIISYLKISLSFVYADKILSAGIVVAENYAIGIDEGF